MLPDAPKLTTAELLQLIEEARNAELCRDIDALRTLLQRVWNDDSCLPSFAEYEPTIRAELLRLYGFFLTTYGRSRNLKNYQSQGKDLLTNAIEIFQSEGLTDKAAEANVILAFCYWNNGEISECEAILSLIENEFRENQFHPVFLQIRINYLMVHYWKQEFDKAIELIEKISVPVSLCKDLRLKAMFHNQAGAIYRKNGLFEDSAFHFSEAIRFARKSNNQRFIAANYNNLSLLHCDKKQFKKAHSMIVKSVKILTAINDSGFLPHVLDTKALICIDENKFLEALKTIEEALVYFYQGDDYNGLTDALWTKVLCLLRLERKEEAINVFFKLQQIALEHIGEVAVRKFIKKFTEQVYIVRHLPFSDELAEFKKARVSTALVSSGGKIGAAAKILGLKNHQALSEMLNKQFPELLCELGFKRRARRMPEGQAQEIESAEIPGRRRIYCMVLTDKHYSFDFKLSSPQFETFYFDKHLMQQFGVNSGAIVAVAPVAKLETGMLILISENDKFSVGIVEFDEWMKIYFISDETGSPIPLDRENIAGEPIGFCSFSEVDNQYIRFSRFKFC